jgi:ATPase subunit of ABC transporter with duplicated ATPase domains
MVQQEVLSSSVPIYQQVLDADVQRAQYAALLKDLEEQFEFQDSLIDCENDSRQWNDEQWQKHLERYVEIGTQWESSGADSREAKVRRILTGLGFSQAMQEEGSERLSGGWRMR